MASPILDGYTVSATIPAQPPWPAVTINYRIALPEKVYDYSSVNRGNGKERMNALVKLLKDNLLGWDLRKKEDETPVLCVEENWRKTPFQILEKIVDYVTGYSIPDGDDYPNSQGGATSA